MNQTKPPSFSLFINLSKKGLFVTKKVGAFQFFFGRRIAIPSSEVFLFLYGTLLLLGLIGFFFQGFRETTLSSPISSLLPYSFCS